jgi:hypothetical protein
MNLHWKTGDFMSRIVAIACMAVMALPVMGSFQLVAPRDGLITLSGTAYAADLPTKAPPPPAPVGKGKARQRCRYRYRRRGSGEPTTAQEAARHSERCG